MFKEFKELKLHVEDALLNILKSKFEDNSDYTYTRSRRTREIDISLVYPIKLRNPDNPIVVVEDATGDFTKRVIGRRHIRDVVEDVVIEGMTVGLTFYTGTTVSAVTAEIRGETYPFTVPVTVTSMNPRIVDNVQGAIMEYLLDEEFMAKSGLVVTDVKAMPKGERIIGNDILKSSGVNVELLTCYETTISILDSQRIGKIISEVAPISVDGTTM